MDCIPVQEEKFTILIGWLGLFFFGAVFGLTFFAFDINNAEEFGPFVVAAGFFGLVTLAFLLMVIAVRRHQLLLYEDFFIYTPYFVRPKTYSYSQIYKLSLAKQSYRLYSPQGKCLATFEDNMQNVPLAIDFLRSKGIRIEI